MCRMIGNPRRPGGRTGRQPGGESHAEVVSLMLAGGGVHFDKRWLSGKFSPSLFIPLHHRIMDVSAVRELARHANPELFVNEPTPKTDHRA